MLAAAKYVDLAPVAIHSFRKLQRQICGYYPQRLILSQAGLYRRASGP